MVAARPPVVMVGGFGAPYAVLSDDERALHVPTLRRDRFTTEAWARLAGLDPGDALVPLPSGEGSHPLRCDAFGCIAHIGSVRVAIARRFDALDADCRLADLVIQLFPGGRSCPTGVPTIRYRDLAIDGTHVLSIDAGGGIVIDTVGASRGHRPWVTTNR
jgi:competence protein ComEC